MNDDAQHWETLQKLFHLAEDLPDRDVDDLLAEFCDDPALRPRARALILTARAAAARAPANAEESSRERIGPYTLLRRLGAGGIGTVYLVERLVGGAVQRAALKMLSRSAAGPFFTERFAREQYILASLQHPNITRMLDAGESADGQPYLVMEYVDGVHLDHFCDAHNLGVADRLDLFLEICEAIAYAHRNLIVHLDLKPSNVLVTSSDGTIKVLDFGTSKLIQPDSLLTTTVMATPAYASPEQLLNEPVTTLCDIYALGAILYELLSGQRPNQDTSVAVLIERSMKEVAPLPITQAITLQAALDRGLTITRLQSLLSGDLSTIVAKCLNTRPKDRYVTVDELMADLRRYRAGRPILARPQTTTYRLGKFVRRNRKLVSFATVALIALLATSSYAIWRQEQAFRAGERALKMQTFMARLFQLANARYLAKPNATVPELLQLGVRVLPDFITDAGDLRAARLSLAESMTEDGDFQHAQPVYAQVIAEAKASRDIGSEAEAAAMGSNNADELGDEKLALALSDEAMSLLHSSQVTPSVRVKAKVFYASIRDNVDFGQEGNTRLLEEAAAESRQLPERERAFALGRLGGHLAQHGQLKEAESVMNEVIAIYGREPYAICDQAEDYGTIGYIRGAEGDLPGSLAFYRKSHDGLVACFGADSEQALEMQVHMVVTMLKLKQAPEAVSLLEASLPAWRRSVGSTSALADPLIYLTRAYLDVGNYAAAEPRAKELVEIQQKAGIGPKTYRMGVSQLVWAQALTGEGRYKEALPHATSAAAALRLLGHPSASQKKNAATAEALLADLRAAAASRTPVKLVVPPPDR